MTDTEKINKFLETCDPGIAKAVKDGGLICRVTEMGIGLSLPDSATVQKRRLAKNHNIEIDTESGTHEEQLQKLEAELQAVQDAIAAHPAVAQAINDGWIEVKHRSSGGIAFSVNSHKIPVGMPAEAAEKIADALGKYVKGATKMDHLTKTIAPGVTFAHAIAAGVPPRREAVVDDDAGAFHGLEEERPRKTLVLCEGPMSKAELDERIALAKHYGAGEQAVLNLCNEFRRRNTAVKLAEEPVGIGF
ncbi:MAG TPA: hypothetical protein VJW94_18210 [Candidatus Acidoferrum sp.]|nr:hypothetical protein [Candidatus Acidoferrum sp.]